MAHNGRGAELMAGASMNVVEGGPGVGELSQLRDQPIGSGPPARITMPLDVKAVCNRLQSVHTHRCCAYGHSECHTHKSGL